jgi:hypothetical protein
MAATPHLRSEMWGARLIFGGAVDAVDDEDFNGILGGDKPEA